MDEPKRYCCGAGEGMFEDNKRGHWIEYSEHKAIVEQLRKELFSVSDSVCLHEPQYQSYNSETKLQICDKCGAITN
jgi:hypothetical protein